MPDNLTTTDVINPGAELFYDKRLLQKARPRLVHLKYADRSRNIPRKHGATVKLRRYNRLVTATTPLVEGVTPNGQRLSKVDILATASQYGDFVHLTDVVDLTVEDPNLVIASEELGDQMGRTIDEIVRDILVSSASLVNASNGDNTETPTEISTKDVEKVELILRGNDAETFTQMIKAGAGVGTTPVPPAWRAILHTDLLLDLKDCTGYLKPVEYPSQTAVDEAEVGAVSETRFVSSTLCHKTAGSPDKYKTAIIARHAYAHVPLDGGQTKNIVKGYGSGGTSDPLNQRCTSGWKTFFTARILNDNFIVLLHCTKQR